MFNHQYNFDIEIPKEVISEEKHDKIFESLIENKVILGLAGYSKSGKDFIAKSFIEDYGFHRVAFADNVKIQMNEHLKVVIFEFIKNNGKNKVYDELVFDELDNGLFLDDGRILTLDMIDFQTEDKSIKRRIRPFIIWYGEKVREINGPYYWINKAFEIDASGYDKIILSDVRRPKELEIFENSNSFGERTRKTFTKATCYEMPQLPVKSYSTLLFHVSQLGLKDSDVLTLETIRIAQETWLFDDTFYVDPRLPEEEFFREKAMKIQINDIAKKFGISVPDKTISPRQMKINYK